MAGGAGTGDGSGVAVAGGSGGGLTGWLTKGGGVASAWAVVIVGRVTGRGRLGLPNDPVRGVISTAAAIMMRYIGCLVDLVTILATYNFCVQQLFISPSYPI